MGRTIGKSLGYGFAGNVSQQPDIIVGTEIIAGGVPVCFGDPVMFTDDGKVMAIDDTFTADKFVGVASSEIRSAVTVDNMDGVYRENDRASVLKRGVIAVICQQGSPAKGAPVYIRIDNAPAGCKIGGFEADDSSPDTIELSNCVWASDKDSNNIAEIRLKTINLV